MSKLREIAFNVVALQEKVELLETQTSEELTFPVYWKLVNECRDAHYEATEWLKAVRSDRAVTKEYRSTALMISFQASHLVQACTDLRDRARLVTPSPTPPHPTNPACSI